MALIGESFFAITHMIPTALTAHARASGAIGPSDSFQDVSVAAAELASGAIGDQVARAAKTHPITTAVINAGLSDIVLGGRCESGLDAPCMEVVRSADALLARLGERGVRQVLFAFYPRLSGLRDSLGPALATLGTELATVCARASAPRCHFVDLTSSFEGHREHSVDGLYPSASGAEVIADALWRAMVEHCVAPR